MKKTRYCLSFVDLFGQPVSLLQNKSMEYNTIGGSLISLGIYAFTLFSFVNMMKDLIEKKDPSTISNFKSNPNPEVTKPKYIIFKPVVLND
jgi:large-conductance mechanosensitive channel